MKTKDWHFRATPELDDQLQELAKFESTTPSDYVRELISGKYIEHMELKAQALEDSKLSKTELLEKYF